jgi:hypothetical protein
LIKHSNYLPLFLLLTLAFSVSSKTTEGRTAAATVFEGKTTTLQVTQALRSFESTLTPYFQMRAGIAVAAGQRVSGLTQADLFEIGRRWNALSPAFKTIYLKATQIPSGMKQFVSPSDKFEIYYFDTGRGAVALTDSIGYSSSSWRTKTPTSNGVPDYVDEVAFAADSAWSMEIDRFGFIKPWAYIDNAHSSSRYKIVLSLAEKETYGYTYPEGAAPGDIGQRSLIETRFEWNDDVWNMPPNDYKTHPEKAVRVTCAHEFFHAIQYSMVHSVANAVSLDDFPQSFTEAMGVLMEDLCFDYINDYFQYLDSFFAEIFSGSMFQEKITSSNQAYKDGILTMFLYHRASPSPRIDFVEKLYFDNYKITTPFINGLNAASIFIGRSWPDILGSFFTESYYTGARAVPGRFIPDAPLLKKKWDYAKDLPDASSSVVKTIQPFGMNTFYFAKDGAGDAGLIIHFVGDSLDPDNGDAGAIYNIRCILARNENPADDSIISLSLFSKSRGSVSIPEWPAFSHVLVVASNARYGVARRASVVFQTCGVSIRKNESVVFQSSPPDPSFLSPSASVLLHANEDLACSLSITKSFSMGTEPAESARVDSLAPAGTFYDIAFPPNWPYSSEMQLTLREPRRTIDHIAAEHEVTDSVFCLYRWDGVSRKWIKFLIHPTWNADQITWQCSIASPGVYGVFAPLRDSLSPSFVAYPNPVRLKVNGGIKITGENLLELLIFSIDGTLISRAIKGENNQPRAIVEVKRGDLVVGFIWHLCSPGGKPVPPGVYFARVGWKDPVTKGMKKKLQKIFVLP